MMHERNSSYTCTSSWCYIDVGVRFWAYFTHIDVTADAARYGSTKGLLSVETQGSERILHLLTRLDTIVELDEVAMLVHNGHILIDSTWNTYACFVLEK